MVFTVTASITNTLLAFEIVVLKKPFVEGKIEVDFTSKYLENVRDMDGLACPPIKGLHKDFVISCSNNNWTLETQRKVLALF